MSEYEFVLVFQKVNISATMVYTRFVETFDFLDMPYLIVTRIVRQMNWNIPAEISKFKMTTSESAT
jgi:hypothetical protein